MLVSADEPTGCMVPPLSRLSKQEVDRMMEEAEASAKVDKEKRDLVDARNSAEQRIYEAEKQLKEVGGKASAGTRVAVEEKVAAVKTALDRWVPTGPHSWAGS